jgi:hypothetical protein
MAVENQVATGGYKASPEKKQCDAYLNIDIIDSEGNAHRFQAFNPVYSDGSGKLHRSLVNKAKASKTGEIEVAGKLTIRIANKDDGKDLTL